MRMVPVPAGRPRSEAAGPACTAAAAPPSPLPLVPEAPAGEWVGEIGSLAGHALRWALAVALARVGLLRAYRAWRRRRHPEGELRVLRYHRVIPDSERERVYRLGVSRRSFRAQVSHLARRHQVVDLAGAEAFIAGRETGPGMRVLVTLDDGYRDNLTEALPELERARVPAVLFVTTGPVGRGVRFPWERLKRVVDDPDRSALPLPGGDGISLGPRGRRRGIAFRRLHRWLGALERAEREAILVLWESRSSPDPRNDGPLSWPEVRRLAASGVAIGSHTVEHPRLSRLEDAVLAWELRESRRRIEEEVGAPVRSLAYPSGDHDARVVTGAGAAGYQIAFTTVAGSNLPGCAALALRRKGTGERSAETPWGTFSASLFEAEVCGLFDHVVRGVYP